METDDILRRFRNERQILASIDHTHIAKLYDGGATEEGLPYFVMGYIEGKNITDYCDGQRLSIAARLKLFQKVCSSKVLLAGSGTDTVDDLGTGSLNLSKTVRRSTRHRVCFDHLPRWTSPCSRRWSHWCGVLPGERWDGRVCQPHRWGDLWSGPDGHEGYNSIAVTGRRLDRRPQLARNPLILRSSDCSQQKSRLFSTKRVLPTQDCPRYPPPAGVCDDAMVQGRHEPPAQDTLSYLATVDVSG